MASFFSPKKVAQLDNGWETNHQLYGSEHDDNSYIPQDVKENILNTDKRTDFLCDKSNIANTEYNEWQAEHIEYYHIYGICEGIIDIFKLNVIRMEIAFMVQQKQAAVLGMDDFNDIGNDKKVVDLQSYIFPNMDNTNNNIANISDKEQRLFPRQLHFEPNTY